MKKRALCNAVNIVLLLFFPAVLGAWTFSDNLSGGTLVIFTPDSSWEVKKEGDGDYGNTYRITPRGSARFQLLMSVIKTPEATHGLDFIREQIEEQGKTFLESSVEKKLNILEIKNGEVSGYYFKLTDKNPRQNGYRQFIQGHLRKERAIISFTYLFNYENAKETESVLATIKSIRMTHGAESNILDALVLKNGDLKGNVRLGRDLICKSIQVQYYFLRPGDYSGAVPPLSEKAIQSIDTGKEKGSVMYFKYKGNVEALKGFFSRIFYRPWDGPTEDNPEEFILHRDLMVILCFDRESSLKKEIKDILTGRLK